MESPGYGYGWVGKKVYTAFLDAFRHAIEGTGCSIDEESESLVRIKSADGVMGCELAVVYYESPTDLWFLRSHENGGYGFMRHRLSHNLDAAADRIIEDSPGNWSKVRKRYLRLKNSDRKGRSSYLLYTKAVSGVYRQLFGDLDGPKPLSHQCLASIIDSYI